MNLNTLLIAAVISISFVTWPIVGKYVGAPGAWVVNLVNIGSLVLTTMLFRKQLLAQPACSVKIGLILIAAGMLNGFGCFLYVNRCTDKSMNTGLFVTMVSIAGIVLAPALNLLINGETLSRRELAGVAVVLLGIILLKK